MLSGLHRDRVLRVVETLALLGLRVITVTGILTDVRGPWRWPNALLFGAAITLPSPVRIRAWPARSRARLSPDCRWRCLVR